MDRCEVAIVGGGPAGAALAIALRRSGRDVVLVERQGRYRWHAGGVVSSPASVAELRRLGVDAIAAGAARPIERLWLEVAGAPALPLGYGRRAAGDPTAVSFDRSVLDPLLLERTRGAGADVRTGAPAHVLSVEPPLLEVNGRALRPVVLVGADGSRSAVAMAAGVNRRTWLPARVGLTCHVAADGPLTDGRMIVLDDGYCGLAPVGTDRVNVGIVVGRAGMRLLRGGGAAALLRHVLGALPPPAAPGAVAPQPDPDAGPLDHLAGAAPLAHRVTRRAGRSWLLVGDAAGFLDPFTGEGLHRALVSARLAAEAIDARLAGGSGALADYDRAMTRRFVGKDIVTALIQTFLGRPALLRYAVRRLADRPAVRERLELVIADLAPASDVLDPRVLLRGLAP